MCMFAFACSPQGWRSLGAAQAGGLGDGVRSSPVLRRRRHQSGHDVADHCALWVFDECIGAFGAPEVSSATELLACGAIPHTDEGILRDWLVGRLRQRLQGLGQGRARGHRTPSGSAHTENAD